MNRYKTRKTNEIWLLGAKYKSGTLDSVDLSQEIEDGVITRIH